MKFLKNDVLEIVLATIAILLFTSFLFIGCSSKSTYQYNGGYCSPTGNTWCDRSGRYSYTN